MIGPLGLRRKMIRTMISGMKVDGEWEDIGQGVCSRCETQRRLYRPVEGEMTGVCADCSQVVEKVAIMKCRGEGLELDGVAEEN